MAIDDAELDALAAGEIDAVDLLALERLARMYETLDPVPPGLAERSAFAITLAGLEAEVAELQRGGDLVGARSDSAADAHTVTFTSATWTTMVTITPSGPDAVRIDGWTVPGARVRIELRLVGTSRHAQADEDGRFVFDEVPRGMAQFLLRPPGDDAGRPVVTPSIDL
jgi:hypothetical protein